MTTETARYSQQAALFMVQAQDELERCDLRQAGEKAWGAAAQAIKAVAEQRGWEHTSHRALSAAVSRLTEESSDYNLARGYASAQSLHTFFYEGGLSRPLVVAQVFDVQNFVGRLRDLL